MVIELNPLMLHIHSSEDLLRVILEIQIKALKDLDIEDIRKIYPHLLYTANADHSQSSLTDDIRRITQIYENILESTLHKSLYELRGITKPLNIYWYNTLKNIFYYLEEDVIYFLKKEGPLYIYELWEFFFEEDSLRKESYFSNLNLSKNAQLGNQTNSKL